MTTFFDPPMLQGPCLQIAKQDRALAGLLTGLLSGRVDWDLRQYRRTRGNLGFSDEQIPVRLRQVTGFLTEHRLKVDIEGADALITPMLVARYPFVDPTPPSLIPGPREGVIIHGYRSILSTTAPLHKCLIWRFERSTQLGRFLIRYTVGERGFVVMPPSWNLERCTNDACNGALKMRRSFPSEREAVSRLVLVEQAFIVRGLALNDELPECCFADEDDDKVRHVQVDDLEEPDWLSLTWV